MPPASVSASAAAERTAAKLEAIRNKMPSSSKAGRVEQKYDVVLDYPNLELHSAAASGNVGLAHYALTHGQPVNSLLHGCLPLHAASSGGDVTVVRLLLQYGADVNAPRLPRRYSENKRSSQVPAVGTAGSTPLHFAAANGHYVIVELLLASGAIPDKPDKNGLRPEDLAEMSGYTDIVHIICIARQMNMTDGDREGAPLNRSARRDSANSAWTGSDTGDSPSAPLSATPSRTERASSRASNGPDKSIGRIRSSFESVRGVRIPPIKTAFSKQGIPPSQPSPKEPSTPRSSECSTPQLVVTTSTPPQPDVDSGPFMESPVAAPLLLRDPEDLPSLDPVEVDQSVYPQRSSRRPSLPSIIEKSSNPGAALRLSTIRNNDDDLPRPITESPPTSPTLSVSTSASTTTPSTGGSGGSFFRGRDRRINKQAILGLFRRGPPSRSPSPPRKLEPTRPIDADEVDANVARLKRASMDPEVMRMALDESGLREQLESVSAPVTKTQFFDEPGYSSRNNSSQSLSTVTHDRPWERRKGSGVISPSPLAREWSGLDDEVTSVPGGVRRTRTEVRRASAGPGQPRRMPSEPQMSGVSLVRRRSMAGYGVRAVSDPASMVGSPMDTPLTNDSGDDLIASVMPSIHALAISRGDDSPDETEEELETTPSAVDVPAFTLDVPDGSAELVSSTELADNRSLDTRRFRGESIGSSTTESSRGLRTPPSSQVTPPGPRVYGEPEFLTLATSSPKRRPARSRGQSDVSMASIIGAGFPPVPEHELPEADRPRPPVPSRRISSHAEARNLVAQTERDVLELAQMPATEDSCRSLADQLAAYGESHAIAEEFARAEGLSSRSGSEGTSTTSGDSLRKRAVSKRHSRHVSSPAPKVLSASVPSINKIYDRREQAYSHLNSLTSTTPICSMRSTLQRNRTVSGEYGPGHRSRASTTSDSWLHPSPGATPQRRLTDPSSTITPRLDANPFMSADPLGIRPSQKGRPRSGVINRANLPPSLKGLGPPPSSSHHRSASGPSPSVGGLGRSVSLHRPNDKVNSVRYQGLAQARQFAASSSAVHVPGSVPGLSALAAQSIHDSTPHLPIVRAPEINEWRVGSAIDPSAPVRTGDRGRWDQFKGALGNLRRS